MIKNTAITFIAAVVLTACTSGMQLEKAKMAGPGGSPFNFNLYGGYIGLSQMEFDEADYEDSDVFADRAMKASKGGKVKPEGFKKRKIPASKMTELRRARGKLMIALAQGGRENYPNLAAKAQVQFDCWMQEQEENLQPKDIAACRSGFMSTMAKLHKAMAPKQMMAMKKSMMKKPMMAKMPDPADVDGIYIVFFDFNSNKLSAAAQQILRKVAADFKVAKPSGMTLTGHSDMAGASKYNTALSRKRLDAVSGYLLNMGVPRTALLPSSYGETKPLVPTKDGMREKRNRRVEIIFQ
ncbi:MAG: OmpA family protein [Alphaproteobacteria bacterium]|nr:OmpA family protein [Alphaproteobacteria bacterium]